MRSFIRLLGVSVLGLGIVHCNAPAPSADPTLSDADPSAPEALDGGAPAAPEAAAPEATGLVAAKADAGTSRDATSDASSLRTDGCIPTAPDPPDDMGADTNCDGADGVVGTDVYVDPTSGQDTNDGTPQTPVQSVGKAQSLAGPRGGNVLVATGQIDGDTLAVSGTWALYGGYSTSFLGPPDRQGTVFAPSANGLLIDASTVSGRLAHVTVQSASPMQGASQISAYALRSEASKLSLDDVVLQASNAASGAPGSDGAAGASGSAASCGGTPDPAYALGQRYNLAGPDGTPPGTIDASGGTPAQQAGAGNDGTDGTDAPSTIALQAALVVAGTATAGLSNGNPGYGGAGGALANGWQGTYTIWGGIGGAGGCPGSGGAPGEGGGSAVALVVAAGEVDITRSALHAGYGGAGGNGGQGGAGGPGGYGTTPEYISPSWPAMLNPSCARTSDDVMQLNCAEYGGQGGPGGAGGHGGGGAGGWSLGVLLAAGATSQSDATTTVLLKKAGTGGIGTNAGLAAGGQSLPLYTLSP